MYYPAFCPPASPQQLKVDAHGTMAGGNTSKKQIVMHPALMSPGHMHTIKLRHPRGRWVPDCLTTGVQGCKCTPCRNAFGVQHKIPPAIWKLALHQSPGVDPSNAICSFFFRHRAATSSATRNDESESEVRGRFVSCVSCSVMVVRLLSKLCGGLCSTSAWAECSNSSSCVTIWKVLACISGELR